MSNSFYNHGSFPSTGSSATSASMRAELDLVGAAFDKMPTLSVGNANMFVLVNSAGTALTASSTLPALTVNDTYFVVQDDADNTRKFRFEATGITPGATRILTVPDSNLTIVGTTTTQTLTNKTLTLPVIASIVNTGTLTLPTSTDTLVGRATTDTLTNKTLTAPVIATIVNTGTLTLPTSTDTLVGRATTDTLTNKTLTLPVIASIVNTGTLTLPTSTDTLVGRATTDTLTNKTMGAFTISGAVSGGGNQINNVIIGTTTPLAGSFTSLTGTGAITLNTTTNNQSYTTTGAGTITISSGTTGTINNMSIGATTPAAGAFTSVTNSGLTTGRVVYTTTGGLETSSANLLYSGTDLTVYGLTVGRGAGAVSTNTAVGASALQGSNSGTGLVAIGANALFTNTSGANNVAIGGFDGTTQGALKANTTGSTNIAIGTGALAANTTASNNAAVGHVSLLANTTGAENVAVGSAALYQNTTGGKNVGLGVYALFANTTASNNTAVGYQAIYSNTVGEGITAVGVQAGYSSANTGGTGYNTFIGRQSGYSLTTGVDSVFVGNVAGYKTTTASNNTALGSVAFYNNTTGAANTAIGRESLFSNTTANNNTAVGYQAGYTNTTGTFNLFLGYQAGYTSSVSGTASNTCIGATAGYSLTTGAYNTFIGNAGTTAGSGYYVTSGSKNTILGNYNGNQGSLDIRTASNYIVLSDGDGNPRGFFDGSGNYTVGAAAGSWGSASGNQVSPAFQQINKFNGVNGDQFIAFSRNSSTIGSITQSGTTAVLFNVTSDQRLKENIVDAPEFGSVIDSIQVRSFDWKTDNTHQRAGFIAQELVTVAPEAVHQPTDTEQMMAVDYSKLVPMLVKEIQSLRKRLAALEST